MVTSKLVQDLMTILINMETANCDGQKDTSSLSIVQLSSVEAVIKDNSDQNGVLPLVAKDIGAFNSDNVNDELLDGSGVQDGAIVSSGTAPLCQSCNAPVSCPLNSSSEHVSLLMDEVQKLKVCNDQLRANIVENNQMMSKLKDFCSSLANKNRDLEDALSKLVVNGSKTAHDLDKLSVDVAALVSSAVDKNSSSSSSDKPVESKSTASSDPAAVAEPTVEERLKNVEQMLLESSNRVTTLATSVEQIERDLQRYIRRHSLVVENLCPKEDRSAQDAFLVFVNSVLRVTADETDIDGLHLIDVKSVSSSGSTQGSPSKSPSSKPSEQRPRPILVTFTCYRTRMLVYKAWLSYRVGASGDSKAAVGSLSGERGQGICIREYLTSAQEVVYQAATDARHRRPDMITDCWTFRGRTFVRTTQGEVRDFAEVDQMVSKGDTKYRSCNVM